MRVGRWKIQWMELFVSVFAAFLLLGRESLGPSGLILLGHRSLLGLVQLAILASVVFSEHLGLNLLLFRGQLLLGFLAVGILSLNRDGGGTEEHDRRE